MVQFGSAALGLVLCGGEVVVTCETNAEVYQLKVRQMGQLAGQVVSEMIQMNDREAGALDGVMVCGVVTASGDAV